MIEIIAGSIRALKPDFTMISEVFGPHFTHVCDCVHDTMTMGPQLFLECVEKRTMTAADYQCHIADVLDAFPENYPRIFFARNHDTSWFYHFNGYSPRLMALEAIHAFFGIPEVFAGDPFHRPNPDENQEIFQYYRRIFAARRSRQELMHGKIVLREVLCDNPLIFAGARTLCASSTVILVSLSDSTENVTVHYAHCGAQTRRIAFEDVLTGESLIPEQQSDGEAIRLQLPPFAVVLGSF